MKIRDGDFYVDVKRFHSEWKVAGWENGRLIKKFAPDQESAKLLAHEMLAELKADHQKSMAVEKEIAEAEAGWGWTPLFGDDEEDGGLAVDDQIRSRPSKSTLKKYQKQKRTPPDWVYWRVTNINEDARIVTLVLVKNNLDIKRYTRDVYFYHIPDLDYEVALKRRQQNCEIVSITRPYYWPSIARARAIAESGRETADKVAPIERFIHQPSICRDAK